MKSLLRDVADVGVAMVTIGQYLRPSRRNLPVVEYVRPEVFDSYREWGEALGLQVHAGAFREEFVPGRRELRPGQGHGRDDRAACAEARLSDGLVRPYAPKSALSKSLHQLVVAEIQWLGPTED